ncbi:unnamed protein product [Peniophora sp. CBMAI 1063]|nr:unnamed protein product [Peniophora sp. CBMAI 1063]
MYHSNRFLTAGHSHTGTSLYQFKVITTPGQASNWTVSLYFTRGPPEDTPERAQLLILVHDALVRWSRDEPDIPNPLRNESPVRPSSTACRMPTTIVVHEHLHQSSSSHPRNDPRLHSTMYLSTETQYSTLGFGFGAQIHVYDDLNDSSGNPVARRGQYLIVKSAQDIIKTETRIFLAPELIRPATQLPSGFVRYQNDLHTRPGVAAPELYFGQLAPNVAQLNTGHYTANASSSGAIQTQTATQWTQNMGSMQQGPYTTQYSQYAQPQHGHHIPPGHHTASTYQSQNPQYIQPQHAQQGPFAQQTAQTYPAQYPQYAQPQQTQQVPFVQQTVHASYHHGNHGASGTSSSQTHIAGGSQSSQTPLLRYRQTPNGVVELRSWDGGVSWHKITSTQTFADS